MDNQVENNMAYIVIYQDEGFPKPGCTFDENLIILILALWLVLQGGISFYSLIAATTQNSEGTFCSRRCFSCLKARGQTCTCGIQARNMGLAS